MKTNKKKDERKISPVQIVNCVLAIALLAAFVSGILLHPLQDSMAVLMLHKLSALILVLGMIVHVVQHRRK